MTINERIKLLLSEKNRTQRDLAIYIDVKQNTVSDWINKGKSPSANLMYRISDFFEVDFNYLFTGIVTLQGENGLSVDEVELTATYRKLDRRGQHRVHTIIYEEVDRLQHGEIINSKTKDIG